MVVGKLLNVWENHFQEAPKPTVELGADAGAKEVNIQRGVCRVFNNLCLPKNGHLTMAKKKNNSSAKALSGFESDILAGIIAGKPIVSHYANFRAKSRMPLRPGFRKRSRASSLVLNL